MDDNNKDDDEIVGLEAFCKSKEKNLLSSLFRCDSDSSASSFSDNDNDNDNNDIMINNDDNSMNNSNDDIFVAITINDAIKKDIYLKQQKVLGIAHQLWPAAVYLCNYINENKESIMKTLSLDEKGKFNLLELGAGLGLCGIYSHCLMSDNIDTTIISDLDEAMDNINYNITLNECDSNVSGNILCWGNEDDLNVVMNQLNPSLPLLVLAADCVYWETLYNPLYQTIHSLVVNHNATILMSYVKRWKKCEKFFKLFQKVNEIKVILMKESVDWIRDENTNKKCKRITRLYSFQKNIM
jgi:predicted nicotinamide N-methyase